jgi:hypothetical protein
MFNLKFWKSKKTEKPCCELKTTLKMMKIWIFEIIDENEEELKYSV